MANANVFRDRISDDLSLLLFYTQGEYNLVLTKDGGMSGMFTVSTRCAGELEYKCRFYTLSDAVEDFGDKKRSLKQRVK